MNTELALEMHRPDLGAVEPLGAYFRVLESLVLTSEIAESHHKTPSPEPAHKSETLDNPQKAKHRRQESTSCL